MKIRQVKQNWAFQPIGDKTQDERRPDGFQMTSKQPQKGPASSSDAFAAGTESRPDPLTSVASVSSSVDFETPNSDGLRTMLSGGSLTAARTSVVAVSLPVGFGAPPAHSSISSGDGSEGGTGEDRSSADENEDDLALGGPLTSSQCFVIEPSCTGMVLGLGSPVASPAATSVLLFFPCLLNEGALIDFIFLSGNAGNRTSPRKGKWRTLMSAIEQEDRSPIRMETLAVDSVGHSHFFQ